MLHSWTIRLFVNSNWSHSRESSSKTELRSCCWERKCYLKCACRRPLCQQSLVCNSKTTINDLWRSRRMRREGKRRAKGHKVGVPCWIIQFNIVATCYFVSVLLYCTEAGQSCAATSSRCISINIIADRILGNGRNPLRAVVLLSSSAIWVIDLLKVASLVYFKH